MSTRTGKTQGARVPLSTSVETRQTVGSTYPASTTSRPLGEMEAAVYSSLMSKVTSFSNVLESKGVAGPAITADGLRLGLEQGGQARQGNEYCTLRIQVGWIRCLVTSGGAGPRRRYGGSFLRLAW